MKLSTDLMALPKGHNPNHPPRGSTIRVEPIRSKKAIKNIKKLLSDQPRNLCLFLVGINTAYRASDLLTIRGCVAGEATQDR